MHRQLAFLFLATFAAAPTWAQVCKPFLPDPPAFPLAVRSSGSAHIVITPPSGPQVSFSSPFSRDILYGYPPDYFFAAVGEGWGSSFFKCNGLFGVRGATAILTSPPFLVTTVVSSTSAGAVQITEDGTNNLPINDGFPCTAAAPCSSDVVRFRKVHNYDLVTGLYTLTHVTDRTSVWLDPSNGNRVVTVAHDEGERTATLKLKCGDERDKLADEYLSSAVTIKPKCQDFTQARQDLNFGDYSWALLKLGMTAGLASWSTGGSPIASAYRNPVHNRSVGGASDSKHMWGVAVDVGNVTQSVAEHRRLRAAALRAGANWIEGLNGPCKLRCVHADWRKDAGGYVP